MISAGLLADHGQWACEDLLTRTGRVGQKYSGKEVRDQKNSRRGASVYWAVTVPGVVSKVF